MQRSEKRRELGLGMTSAGDADPVGKHGRTLPVIREVQT